MNCGLYIHIPFCLSRCGYCHFLSLPYESAVADRYCNAVLDEIGNFSVSGRHTESVDSIYFGGGTPSTVDPQQIRKILEACRRYFRLGDGCEISLEANPGTLSATKVSSYGKSGINRISIGAQSFIDEELAAVGRIHTGSMVRESLRLLKEAGFDNLNLDLMLGLPNQTRDSWLENLNAVAHLEIPHISVYMLDLDEACPLSEMVQSAKVLLPDEELVSDLYLETIELLASQGYQHYEISNFARPGYACRHNLKYWMRDPVYGFGLGSHSFDGTSRWANLTRMDGYLTAVENGRGPLEWKEAIGEDKAVQETLFLGLRLADGINWRFLQSLYGAEALSKQLAVLQDLAFSDLTRWDGDRVRLTPSGMLVSNEIFQLFV